MENKSVWRINQNLDNKYIARWGSKLTNFERRDQLKFVFISDRYVSPFWLRRLYSVEQKKINRAYVRDKRKIWASISQFQQFYYWICNLIREVLFKSWTFI